MSKQELITIRDTTYREPPEKRCQTCKNLSVTTYSLGYSTVRCNAVSVRGKLVGKIVNSAGVCDLWENGGER